MLVERELHAVKKERLVLKSIKTMVANQKEFCTKGLVWPKNAVCWKKTFIVVCVMAVAALFLISADIIYEALLSAII